MPTEEVRHVVHRRRRPRGVQGVQEPRRRLEVRRLPDPAKPQSRSSTSWSEPAGRAERLGHRQAASDPRCKMFGEQLEDAKSPPAIATWEQVAASLDDEHRAGRPWAGRTRRAALKAAESKANAIGTGSLTMATWYHGGEAGSTSAAPGPAAGPPPGGARRPTASPLPFLVLFLVFTAGPVLASLGDELHRPAQHATCATRSRSNLVGLDNYTKLLQRRHVPASRVQHRLLRASSACR